MKNYLSLALVFCFLLGLTKSVQAGDGYYIFPWAPPLTPQIIELQSAQTGKIIFEQKTQAGKKRKPERQTQTPPRKKIKTRGKTQKDLYIKQDLDNLFFRIGNNIEEINETNYLNIAQKANLLNKLIINKQINSDNNYFIPALQKTIEFFTKKMQIQTGCSLDTKEHDHAFRYNTLIISNPLESNKNKEEALDIILKYYFGRVLDKENIYISISFYTSALAHIADLLYERLRASGCA